MFTPFSILFFASFPLQFQLKNCFLFRSKEEIKEAKHETPTPSLAIPTQAQETRLLSTSAPQIESKLEWFQVKSKKEKSLAKKQQKQEQRKRLDEAVGPKNKALTKKTKNAEEEEEKNKKKPETEDPREELDFMFDEEIPKKSSPPAIACVCSDSSEDDDDEDDYDDDSDYDYDYDDLDDQTVSKLVIITQQTTPTPIQQAGNTAARKHGGMDRTGDFLPRSKISADLARAINDGLFYYEQDLKKANGSTTGKVFEKTSVVSTEQFSKLKNLSDNQAWVL